MTERRGSLASGLVADAKSWREAWEESAYGSTGFYLRQEPYAHFTTSVQQSRICAQVQPWLEILLRHEATATVVDAGAGSGQLLAELLEAMPAQERTRVRLIAMDLRPRPQGLAPAIEWWQGDVRRTSRQLPAGPGLLVAHELLDDIPCEVVEVDEQGRLHLLMHDQGEPLLGPELGPDARVHEQAWLAQWWPASRALMRAEVGLPRDRLWHSLTRWLTAGYAIAFDYGHLRADRQAGLWDGGTLAGYLHGRMVAPRITPPMNLTAHVAMDAIAAAAAGSPRSQLLRTGPTGDFWRLVQAWGGLPWPTDRIRR